MQRFVENYDASKKNYKCNATFLIFFSTIIVYSFDKYQIRGLLESEKKVGGGRRVNFTHQEQRRDQNNNMDIG